MKSLWKFVAVLLLLSLAAGCTPPTAPATPASGGATLKVGGLVNKERAFTEAELRALGTRETDYTNKDGETTTYTGVPFTTLLPELGVSATSKAALLYFVAGDGYEAQVNVDEVLACPECIVAFQPAGGFRAVLPGFTTKVQVRDLVEIEARSAVESLSPPASETGEEVIPNDGPVTVTDAAGRAVSLERLPRRIVVAGRGTYMGMHLLYTFPEGRKRLVGVESKSASQSDFIVQVDPEFESRVAGLAANPNPEQIAALEPDLVLMKSVALDDMGEVLTGLNIPVVYLGLETPEQFFQDVTNLGLLLGNPTRAQEVIAFYQSRLDRVRSQVAQVPENERPHVLLLEYSDRGSEVAVKVPAMAWMQTFQVKTAGGNPVWGSEAQITDGWTVVNVEQIAAWDPDKIFIVMAFDLDAQAIIDSLKADAYWSKLTAVKNGELYAYPMDHFQWDTPEPRWILGFTWLATRIHPGLFADVDLQEEIYAFFGELYGMDRAAVDKTIMPKVLLDVH
ncbi:MAG: ABC transporter substrate-binding protein [Anaerolineae bacterium]|nr:ABC transporter substrate-binding protein [Anaerolineae bacterium]